jgi:uncharacterized protein (UPF0332 family)
MSFNWEHYLSLAKVMKEAASQITEGNAEQQGFREACLRSAISRSYYGVFCEARNLLVKHGIRIREVDVHKFVREKYLNAGDAHVKKVGANLLRLWGDRKIADYDDEMDTETDVEVVNDLAARTLKRIRSLESEALLSFSSNP